MITWVICYNNTIVLLSTLLPSTCSVKAKLLVGIHSFVLYKRPQALESSSLAARLRGLKCSWTRGWRVVCTSVFWCKLYTYFTSALWGRTSASKEPNKIIYLWTLYTFAAHRRHLVQYRSSSWPKPPEKRRAMTPLRRLRLMVKTRCQGRGSSKYISNLTDG